MTAIEWTDETWNPTVGCWKVSPGCDGCYAISVAHRAMQPAHEGLTVRRPGERPDWTGEVRLLPDRLDAPFRWRKPRRVFVDSMSDLFHPDVPNSFVVEVFARMLLTPRHTYQVLTKRPQRMAALLAWPKFATELEGTLEDLEAVKGAEWGAVLDAECRLAEERLPLFPNVWLGTSIESDRYAWRADHLRNTPAAVRFLSLEPLLGPLPSLDLTSIDWVIVGGESGPGARPMHPAWVRDLRDRCADAEVPFFFKQWGEWAPALDGTHRVDLDGDLYENTPTCLLSGEEMIRRVGKKAAGRLLDGRTWDEYPGAAA